MVVACAALVNSFIQTDLQKAALLEANRPRLEVHPTLMADGAVKKGVAEASFDVMVTIKNVGTGTARNIQGYELLVVTNSIQFASKIIREQSCSGPKAGHPAVPVLYRDNSIEYIGGMNTVGGWVYLRDPDPFYMAGNVSQENSSVDETYLVGCVTYKLDNYDKTAEEDYAYKVYSCEAKMPNCGPLGISSPVGAPDRVSLVSVSAD